MSESMHIDGWGYEEEESDMINAFDGLNIIYNGEQIEGTYTAKYVAPKPKAYRDIIFSLDGKKYKLVVEEID